MTLYHGNGLIIEKPNLPAHGAFRDFGYGFYCVKTELPAKRQALSKKHRHVVNQYEFVSEEGLKVCCFPEISDEWLSFLSACRRGKSHNFDIVEGPMVDDTIWDYVESYMAKKFTKEIFLQLVSEKKPAEQVVFCTEKALQALVFQGSYEV